MNQNRGRNTIFYLVLFAIIIFLVIYNFQRANSQQPLTINEVAAAVQAEKVAQIVEDDNKLRVTYKEGDIERTSQKESTATLVEQLTQLGVTPDKLSPNKIKIQIKPPSRPNNVPE